MGIFLFNSFLAKSQETTDYWFEGYVHTAQQASPYCTVVLTEKGSDKIKSVSLSSPTGLIDFRGVAIDIYKEHILSVYCGDVLIGKFIREGFKHKPQFVGNLNTHIRLPETPSSFYTENRLSIDATHDEEILRDFLLRTADLEEDNGVYYLKNSDAPLRIFINHQPLAHEQIQTLLSKVPMQLVKAIVINTFTHPNAYFSGAISIVLKQGQVAEFPKDKIHKTLTSES